MTIDLGPLLQLLLAPLGLLLVLIVLVILLATGRIKGIWPVLIALVVVVVICVILWNLFGSVLTHPVVPIPGGSPAPGVTPTGGSNGTQ
jgi:hypothetical protein